MAQTVKAYISKPDSGVSGLRPDLYDADRTWLERTAADEARRILAETEGINPGAGIYGETVSIPALRRARRAVVQGLPYRWNIHTDHGLALAEALAAFVADDAE